MWKFILFILIAAVAIWQLSIINFDKDTKPVVEKEIVQSDKEVQQQTTEKKVEKQVVQQEKKAEEKSQTGIKISALKGALQGIEEEPKESSVKEEKAVEEKEIASSLKEVKSDSQYEDLLANEAANDDQSANAAIVKSDNTLGMLAKPKKEQVSEYEQMLMDEVGSEGTDTNEKQSSAAIGIKKDALLGLIGDGKKEEETKEAIEEKPITSTSDKTVLRDSLKKLLSAAVKTIETDEVKELSQAEDVKAQNAISIKTKSAKDLLHDLVAQVSDSNGASNQYVENLLKEVSTSKIRILEVKKGYTTVMVKQGDTLSGLAESIYGDAAKYPLIFEANKDVISNPNSIYVGLILKIPKE